MVFMVGPLDCLAWEQSRVSPLGVATGRYSGKKRLILDLSSPHDKEGVLSINDHIDKTKFSLEYTTVVSTYFAIFECIFDILECRICNSSAQNSGGSHIYTHV